MEERIEHREIFLKKLIEGLNKENVEYSFLKKEPEEKPVTKDEMIWVIEKKSGTTKMLLNVPVFDPSDMDRWINEIIGAVGKALNKIKRDTYNCAEIINETKNYETVKDNLFLKAVNISKEKIKKVIVEEGVTNIGEKAFEGCGLLTELEISKSVTEIKNSAFSDCKALININVDNNNESYTS